MTTRLEQQAADWLERLASRLLTWSNDISLRDYRRRRQHTTP